MKLIKKTDRQRFYQLDFEIKKFKHNGVFGLCGEKIKPISEILRTELKTPWAWDEDLSRCDKVCVSDAITHIERLVFPVWRVRNAETQETIDLNVRSEIAGVMTFVTQGGDESTIREDEEYIKELRLLQEDEK